MSALEGIKVLDLTSMVSGPVAAMMLADQGAEVIKVEPTTGEQMRHIGPTVNKVTAAFFSCNRGKRSIAVDLKSDDGKKILFRSRQGCRRLAAELPARGDGSHGISVSR